MWIETYDGRLVNLDYISNIEIEPAGKDGQYDYFLIAYGPPFSIWQPEAIEVRDKFILFAGDRRSVNEACRRVANDLMGTTRIFEDLESVPRNADEHPEPHYHEPDRYDDDYPF